MDDMKVGDTVFHRRCGLCRIDDVAPLPGDDPSFLYYVLSPLYGDEKGNIVRVPTANPIFLRPVITENAAKDYVDGWPSFKDDHYIADSKKRKQSYEEALSKGDIYLMAPLIVGAMQRKSRDGHLNSMDLSFVNKAQPMVFGELSLALGLSYDEVSSMLLQQA